VFLLFEIDEEFMINYKAYKTFLLEYKKRLELEKNLNENVKEISNENIERTLEKNLFKSEEKNESVLN
jgi:hypothetical protein